MKKSLSILFTVGFVLFLSAYTFAGQYSINGTAQGSYSSMTIDQNGALNIVTQPSSPPSGNTIMGQVTSDYFGTGKTIGTAGVTMTLGGTSSATSTTNTNGNYTFTGLADGSYTVTPSSGSYTFNPTSGNPSVASNSTATVNFSATPSAGKTYSIAGNVKDKNGANLQGVTMQLQWGSTILDNTDLTGADGNYTIADLPDGLTYTVTPIMAGKSFTPASQYILVNGSNVTGKNFVEQSGTALGSLTNPIPINKSTTKISSGYIPSTCPDNGPGDYTVPKGTKVYFMVDPLATTGRSVSIFAVIMKFYGGGGRVCKVTQNKTTGAYSSEDCDGYTSLKDYIYDNSPYDIDNTRFLYSIDNSTGTAGASAGLWAVIP